MTEFSCIIFLKIWTMVSNFKIIPYFNILQNFVQNVRKPKWPSILSWFCSLSSSLNIVWFQLAPTRYRVASIFKYVWFHSSIFRNRTGHTCEWFASDLENVCLGALFLGLTMSSSFLASILKSLLPTYNINHRVRRPSFS